MENNNLMSEKIHKLYDNLTYFDLYSSSLIIVVILTIIIFLAYAFSITMNNSATIKNDWVNQRCKPQVMPFAGFINKPDDGTTIFQYTGNNFSYCIQNIVSSIAGHAVEPFHYTTNILTTIYNDISDAIMKIRYYISNVRDALTNITKNIMNRLMNVMIPLQVMLMSLMDGLRKVQGVLTTSLMAALGGYLTLQTLMGSILDFIIKILLALVIIIIGLWAGFFTWPVAATMTIAFLAISIPLAIIIIIMTQIMNIHADSIPRVPSKPSCFDGNTYVVMNDGTTKKIKDIRIGDVLQNENIVKSFIKLSSKKQKMYTVSGIIVSGTHSIYYNGEWMVVYDCPNAIPVSNYHKKEGNEFIYCLNTEKKKIPVKTRNVFLHNSIIDFCDWDELIEEEEIKRILKNVTFDNITKVFEDDYAFFITKTLEKRENINEYLDTGFKYNCVFTLSDGKIKNIANIVIGDVLQGNNIVLGIVEMGKRDGTILYNLITDTSEYTLTSGEKCNDYNFCIDKLCCFFSV